MLNEMLGITRIFILYTKGVASASRISVVLEAESDMPVLEAIGEIEAEKSEYHIEFRNVDSSYNGKQNNLTRISFALKSGQTLGIICSTGSGKSTIINLLIRFYDAVSGEIRLDGESIYGVTRDSLRRGFSMVLQDTWLFGGIIFENIAYGKENVTRQQVEEAAKAAKIHSYIMRLPDGYDTVITDNGKGQKQLITIARAMLLDSKILILDEATSNVDTETR